MPDNFKRDLGPRQVRRADLDIIAVGDQKDLVDIHGLAGSSTNWTRLAAALSPAATGYSVDLPGHGRSDPPPRGHYSLRADAELIAAVIEQVSGAPVHLVGNSFGGIIATLLAAARPELVRTLTVISPAVPDLRLTGDRGADPRLGLLLVPGTAGLAYRRLATISPLTSTAWTSPKIFESARVSRPAGEGDWMGSR